MTPNTDSTHSLPSIEQGEALFSEGKYGEALLVFRDILSADPTNSAALNDAGITWGAMGDIERSFDCLNAALQADPHCAPAFYNLIDLAISCEALEAARNIFMLFHKGIAGSNEKAAFEDMLFSPEMDALIEARRQAVATTEREETRMKLIRIINEQTQRLARSAA